MATCIRPLQWVRLAMQTRHTMIRQNAPSWKITTTTALPEDPSTGRPTGQTGKLVANPAVLYYHPTQKRPCIVHALSEDSQNIMLMFVMHHIYPPLSNLRTLTTF